MLTTLSSLIAILTPTMAGLASIIVMTYRVTNSINDVKHKVEMLQTQDKQMGRDVAELKHDVHEISLKVHDLENWASMQRRNPIFRKRSR